MRQNISVLGYIGASWAVLGIIIMLLVAVVRTGSSALGIASLGLTSIQLLVLVIWILFMVFIEGYRGFQKKFSPRYAARTLQLMQSPRILDVALAPFFCAGYYRINKKRFLVTWSITIMISLAVIAVSQIAQPWRGIISFGVTIGLSYGILSLFYFFTRITFAKNPALHEEPGEQNKLGS